MLTKWRCVGAPCLIVSGRCPPCGFQVQRTYSRSPDSEGPGETSPLHTVDSECRDAARGCWCTSEDNILVQLAQTCCIMACCTLERLGCEARLWRLERGHVRSASAIVSGRVMEKQTSCMLASPQSSPNSIYSPPRAMHPLTPDRHLRPHVWVSTATSHGLPQSCPLLGVRPRRTLCPSSTRRQPDQPQLSLWLDQSAGSEPRWLARSGGEHESLVISTPWGRPRHPRLHTSTRNIILTDIDASRRFSQQPWITPSLFENTGNTAIVDEWTFGQDQNRQTALSALQNHWNTWVTEQDFIDIAAAGYVTWS